jgi:anti-sigma regulatory factor (Ser/Thr protein kinase)
VVTLQRSLLPDSLDAGGEYDVAVEYRPASSQLEAGGDWYDVIPLPGGSLALVTGDVVGRGVGAAAVMGQLRTACAALASTSSGPAELISRLESFAAAIEGADFTTMVAVFVDPVGRTIRYTCAGHPPPMLLTPGRAPSLLDGTRSAPLGGPRRSPRPEQTAPLDHGATLVLYTDGLVERRGESIDCGLERLLRAADDLDGAAPDDLVHALLAALTGDHAPTDDLVVMAVRFTPLAHAVFTSLLRADPERLHPMRHALKDWLTGLGYGEDRIGEEDLAVGEAATNAVEHAYRDGEPGEVQIQAWVGPDDALVVTVRDFGRWQDLPAEGLRGHGARIMQALAQVRTVRSPAGTTVHLRFSSPAEVAV